MSVPRARDKRASLTEAVQLNLVARHEFTSDVMLGVRLA